MSPAIFFFHIGKIPFYLNCALESARYFNPESRIFLITDQVGSKLASLKIECIPPETVEHPKLSQFLKSYVHISSCHVSYERRCFERWFYFEQLRAQQGIEEIVVLDSDAVLFSDAQSLFSIIPEQFNFACSKGGGPALTLIRRSIEPFLDHMLERYTSATYLEQALVEQRRAHLAGEMKNLTDMTFCEEFTAEHPLACVYPNQNAQGHLDHGIFLPDGMKARKAGRRHRKKVLWKLNNTTLIPYFIKEDDGTLTKALVIHFQSKGKRLIRSFNPINPSFWTSKIGLKFRLLFLNSRMS